MYALKRLKRMLDFRKSTRLVGNPVAAGLSRLRGRRRSEYLGIKSQCSLTTVSYLARMV